MAYGIGAAHPRHHGTVLRRPRCLLLAHSGSPP